MSVVIFTIFFPDFVVKVLSLVELKVIRVHVIRLEAPVSFLFRFIEFDFLFVVSTPTVGNFRAPVNLSVSVCQLAEQGLIKTRTRQHCESLPRYERKKVFVIRCHSCKEYVTRFMSEHGR